MACETRLRDGQTLAARFEETRKAIAKLEQALKEGKVKVGIGPNGAVLFAQWGKADRSDVSDVCAYRTLTAASSWALKQAVAKAEQMTGRKVNPLAVAQGCHSHDNGKTWEKH